MNISAKSTLLLFLILLSSHLIGQSESKIIYPEFFQFHSGDNIYWANPIYDDSKWQKYPLNSFPEDEWTGVGWARITIKVDSSLQETPLGLKLNFVGAVEIYLDGKLIHRYGKIGKNVIDEKAVFVFEHPDVAVFSFRAAPADDQGYSTHKIAIRTSNFIVHEGILQGLSPVFNFDIGAVEDLRAEVKSINRIASIHQYFFLGILLAFSISYFLLYLYYKKFKLNLIFALLTLFTAFLIFFRFERLFIDEADALIWNLRLFNFFGVLTLLAFLRFTYFLVYEQLPKIFVLFSFLGAVLYIWFLFKPMAAWDYVTILFMIIVFEMIRVIFTSRIKKRELIYEHSSIILFGLLPFAFFSIYKALVVLVDVPELWNFISFPYTYYSLLVVLISMSVFLARNFAKTNKDLEYQLEQIKSLSEKNLRQELEKAKLQSENERKTKELEEARKLQLSMLPKEVPVSANYEIAVFMQTATEVGGDYYDFIEHKNESLTIAVGDATGHGMQAGTMVAASKSLFKSMADIDDPSIILKQSSNALKEMGFSLMLMAMTIAKLGGNKIYLSSAGMPFTLIYRNDTKSVEEVILKGMPLGGFRDFPYKSKKIKLSKGDTILFMSDGYPELFNNKNEMLGYEKATGIFKRVANEPAKIVIEKLLGSAKEWADGHPQEDDITFVVIKIK
ncbi:MAG: SpoIIE family protein phosphatase [Ignavibacterium sp.]|nr:MAG: SpoIIE family protein phosphatase [Ignavibacterium sp.]